MFYEETDNAEEGTIIQVIRDGYKLGDMVLRAAQVSVARAVESENQSDNTQQEA